MVYGDNSDYDGDTILIGSNDNEYIFVCGFEIIKSSAEDKFIDFISLMGNNMISKAIAVGEKYKYFISDHYEFLENFKIEEGTLLNSTNDSLEPFDYHLAKCGEGAFETMECNQIHTCFPDEEVEEDDCGGGQESLFKPDYCNGNNEMVKIFNQKCVLCL